MNKIFTVITLIFVAFISVAQKIELRFHPAFLSSSRCIINRTNSTCLIQLDIFKGRDTSLVVLTEIDTIPSESYEQLLYFFRENKVSSRTSVGEDGLFIIAKYVDGTAYKEFVFWSPRKETNEHNLFQITFITLHKFMKDKNSKKYLRSLKTYLN